MEINMEYPYQHKTSFYKEGRLGYSEKAVQLITDLVPSLHSVIADIGSGTGIFSSALLEKGYIVYGVEPNSELQKKAKSYLYQYERFFPVDAFAENTALPDCSMDAITVASAFHWLKASPFLYECRRILKPEAYVFLLYNVRQTDDMFSQKQACICKRYCPGFFSFSHGAEKAKQRCSAFFVNGYEERLYSHNLVYTEEQFLSRCMSSSYSLNQTQKDYILYKQELENLIAEYSKENLITIHNQTAVWYGKVK